ncbi:hypothetical protein [Paraburkholderia acidipaludis]|uniref:hypothetical protein n=1 Tax=Paraburkholderia acidipaludis TaxID=660537 RepID=UPI0012EC1B53|nr:hypothetical protein [Paraburkholderia acidipaludis]
MNFKNDFEKECFEVVRRILGSSACMEHNKVIRIENALYPEVASFKGPPAKEVDVLVVDLLDSPKVTLLISCKDFSKRAEPAHVQEWAAVVRTLNGYSNGTLYLGLVISSKGFTGGCEAWATSHNLGLIPPLKGKSISYAPEAVLAMLERVMKALQKRVRISHADMMSAPGFFDLIYSLVSDFEGHEEVAKGGRFYSYPNGWISSFSEMYSSLAGHVIEGLIFTSEGAAIICLSEGIFCRFGGDKVEFGSGISVEADPAGEPRCIKNISGDLCDFDFIKSTSLGLPISSAADFGDCIEFGLDGRFNLGLHSWGFHIVSTQNPVEDHLL